MSRAALVDVDGTLIDSLLERAGAAAIYPHAGALADALDDVLGSYLRAA